MHRGTASRKGSPLLRPASSACCNWVTAPSYSPRSQAISAKIRFAFVADIEGNQYWISNLKTREKSKFRKLGHGIKIAEFTDHKDAINKETFYIVFYPQGNSSGGSILMEAKDPGDSRDWFQVSVDPVTGKPSVHKGEG